MPELRVVDAGTVSAGRSQALWHGLAEVAPEGGPPTLSLCRSAEPYVGLGYHHPLASVDLQACKRLGLPVIRRRIGGGAVYVDADQLLFQLTLPADEAPGGVARLYRLCLSPAVAAFQALGLDARLGGVNDISVGDRKISGTGAGRIGAGVTVVGNIIFRFPHRRMTEVLALGADGFAADCLRLMRRHVSSLEREGLRAVGRQEAGEALVAAYSEAFGRPRRAMPSATEEAAIDAWQDRFADPRWLQGPAGPLPAGRRLKVAEGVWLVAADDGDLGFRAAIVGGRFASLTIAGGGRNGSLTRLARALEGVRARPGELGRRMAGSGADGERLARLLAPCLTIA